MSSTVAATSSSSSGAEAVVELLLEQQQLESESSSSLDVTGVKTLLEGGANPNACVREDDVSPMHIAAGLDNDAAYAYLALLLKFQGDPNVQSSEGLTPLHIAAIWGRREALNLLLEHGADATMADADGKTALDWAREESGDACSIKLLEEAIKAQLKTIRTNSRNNSLSDSESQTLSKYQSPKFQVEQFLEVRKKLRNENSAASDRAKPTVVVAAADDVENMAASRRTSLPAEVMDGTNATQRKDDGQRKERKRNLSAESSREPLASISVNERIGRSGNDNPNDNNNNPDDNVECANNKNDYIAAGGDFSCNSLDDVDSFDVARKSSASLNNYLSRSSTPPKNCTTTTTTTSVSSFGDDTFGHVTIPVEDDDDDCSFDINKYGIMKEDFDPRRRLSTNSKNSYRSFILDNSFFDGLLDAVGGEEEGDEDDEGKGAKRRSSHDRLMDKKLNFIAEIDEALRVKRANKSASGKMEESFSSVSGSEKGEREGEEGRINGEKEKKGEGKGEREGLEEEEEGRRKEARKKDEGTGERVIDERRRKVGTEKKEEGDARIGVELEKTDVTTGKKEAESKKKFARPASPSSPEARTRKNGKLPVSPAVAKVGTKASGASNEPVPANAHVHAKASVPVSSAIGDASANDDGRGSTISNKTIPASAVNAASSSSSSSLSAQNALASKAAPASTVAPPNLTRPWANPRIVVNSPPSSVDAAGKPGEFVENAPPETTVEGKLAVDTCVAAGATTSTAISSAAAASSSSSAIDDSPLAAPPLFAIPLGIPAKSAAGRRHDVGNKPPRDESTRPSKDVKAKSLKTHRRDVTRRESLLEFEKLEMEMAERSRMKASIEEKEREEEERFEDEDMDDSESIDIDESLEVFKKRREDAAKNKKRSPLSRTNATSDLNQVQPTTETSASENSASRGRAKRRLAVRDEGEEDDEDETDLISTNRKKFRESVDEAGTKTQINARIYSGGQNQHTFNSTGIMGVDQPTFQECSLTIVTGRGSNEVNDFTSVSWQPSSSLADSRNYRPSSPADEKHLPPPPQQQEDGQRQSLQLLPQHHPPGQGRQETHPSRSKGTRIVMGTSVIMDKFLHSFDHPTAAVSSVEPEGSVQPASASALLKSFAEDSSCDSISVTPLDCPSETLEASSASRASSYATCINCERTAIEYMYTDDQEQVQLIERVYSSACTECCVDRADGEVCPEAPPYIPTPEVSFVSVVSCTNDPNVTSATDAESVISLNFDWRACRQGKTWRKQERGGDTEDEVSNELKNLPDGELRQQLIECGDRNPPPVTSSFVRLVLQKKLAALRKNPLESVVHAQKPLYASELAAALQGHFCFSSAELEMTLMESDFATLDDELARPPSGINASKTSFNYLLIDPRVTRNLPARLNRNSSEVKKLAAFRTFVASIFYVGKGTGLRPFAHFYDAIKTAEPTTTTTEATNNGKTKRPSEKIQQIHDIWGKGVGVVSHHFFQSLLPNEAFTREAVMIEALGLENLSNKVRGKSYGLVGSWEPKRRRKLGVFLLHKAFQLYLIEGEHQLRRRDVK